MRYKMIEKRITYSGSELRSAWVGEQIGFAGDAAIGFIGPCNVPTENLVDMDDASAGTFIKAASMAHVLIEHPGCALAECVLRQRLLVAILVELLRERTIECRRDGDDLYVQDRKLTVSIAAPSPASSLIHLGINVDPEGAPVPAIGLDALAIDARELLDNLLERYAREMESCEHATGKVRAVP